MLPIVKRGGAYLDDILIYSNTFSEHLAHLKALFKRCRAGSLHLNPNKSTLCARETSYLGLLVSAKGVRPDPNKIKPVMELPEPKDHKNIRKFLGTGSYYRSFIKNYAIKAAPLQALLSEKVAFKWTDKHRNAFQDIKSAIANATLMHYPHPTKQFIIDCDAALEGLGAVLHQVGDDNKEYPICFASRSLKQNEKSWGITELEALAVVWALETFRLYIDSFKVLARTDHSPLLWIKNNAAKSARIARWVMCLQGFQIKLQHRASKANVVADALSRSPLPYTEQNVARDSLDNKPQLCSIVHGPGRCQSCWGPARIFLKGGGRPEAENAILSGEQMAEKATKLVREEENDAKKRKMEVHPGVITIKKAQAVCDACIVFRQYIEKAPRAELPRWVVAAGLKPMFKKWCFLFGIFG